MSDKQPPIYCGIGMETEGKYGTFMRLSMSADDLDKLHDNLNEKGWVTGEWGQTDTGRRARFYSLTKKGWKALQGETARWQEHIGAVDAVLRHSEG